MTRQIARFACEDRPARTCMRVKLTTAAYGIDLAAFLQQLQTKIDGGEVRGWTITQRQNLSHGIAVGAGHAPLSIAKIILSLDGPQRLVGKTKIDRHVSVGDQHAAHGMIMSEFVQLMLNHFGEHGPFKVERLRNSITPPWSGDASE